MSSENTKICGIIMPISQSDDKHTAEYWEQVMHIIETAVMRAGLTPKPVWESGQHDVIQSKILQNIFENDVVVCDVSTRNPNVMLEWGMRLTTKKPTVVIAETGTHLPFDTSAIHTLFYENSLDWSATETFLSKLTERIKEVVIEKDAGRYKSYLETYQFERIQPEIVTVSTNDAVLERLDEMSDNVGKLSRQLKDLQSFPTQNALDYAGIPLPLPVHSDNALKTVMKVKTSEFSVGDRISHEKYGLGVVTRVQGNRLDINFNTIDAPKRVMDFFVKKLA